MNISNITSSSLYTLSSLSILEHTEYRKVILAEELHQLTSLEELPSQILIQGNVEICASNMTSFTFLHSKDVEIDGSLTCRHLSLSTLPGQNAFEEKESCFLPQKLKIKGHVNFRSLFELCSLPDFFEVEGDLNLYNCTNLTILPKGLKVGGSLNLSSCNMFLHLPDDLEVGNDLNLSSCQSLKELPKGLKVGGSLDLSNCNMLLHLPEDLEVGKDLNLSSCQSLKELPKGLKVGCSLNLSNCKNFLHLSEDLDVGKDLNLSYCWNFKELPKGLKIEGFLNLSNCWSFKELPKELKIEGFLNLSNCWNLKELPQGFKVGGSLKLSHCSNLTLIPEDLEVGKDLNLSSCQSLEELPKELKVRGSLNLSNCNTLLHVPEDLEIGKDLDLSNCLNLTTLPKRLKVGGSLNLSHCSALIFLPNHLGMQIGGNLNLSGCRNITSLPNWISTLGSCSDGCTRTIDLTETGISFTIINRLQEETQDIEGIQFHFSMLNTRQYIHQFTALLPALKFWQEQETVKSCMELEEICLQLHQNLISVQDHQNLLIFLTRLTGTADYSNLVTRTNLASRVLQMIQLLAKDKEMGPHIALLIHQGLASCDDRVMATLDDITLYQKIRKLEDASTTSEELKKAGRGFFLLEELNKKIKLHITTLHFVDEVEAYMAFYIRLQNILRLPMETKTMIFRGCAAISDEEIDFIGNRILQETTEAAFETFLTTWDPWKRYQRKVSVVAWDKLPIANQKLLPEDICPYLQDKPESPVLYGNTVYDYNAFIRRYIEEGVDLNREIVQIKNLFRITDSVTSETLKT